VGDNIDNGIADANDIDAGLRHLAEDDPARKPSATITALGFTTRSETTAADRPENSCNGQILLIQWVD
jgi:hypothetical protein